MLTSYIFLSQGNKEKIYIVDLPSVSCTCRFMWVYLGISLQLHIDVQWSNTYYAGRKSVSTANTKLLSSSLYISLLPSVA